MRLSLSQRINLFAIITMLAIAVLLLANPSQTRSGCPLVETTSTEDAQVFLMGTIGGDHSDPQRDCWREYTVQPVLEELNVTYFNPVVSNWTEENAEIEARAIANAETIVLVITDNHPSIGSLAESGWAVLSSIERHQTIIIFIADKSDDDDSQRARHIVLSQARTLADELDNVFLAESLDAVNAVIRQTYGDYTTQHRQ